MALDTAVKLRIDAETYRLLSKQARESERTISAVIRRAIRHYLEDERMKRQLAHNAVAQAIQRGELEEMPCEIGENCAGAIHAHHENYDRPLDVRWLCRRHHYERHLEMGTYPYAETPKEV